MLFGLDSTLASPPFSAILALILMAGCDALGLKVARCGGLLDAGAPPWQRFQAPVLGAVLLSILLYPLALAGWSPRWFLQAVACGLIAWGGIHAVFAVRRLARDYRPASIRHLRGQWMNGLSLLILIGLALTAAGPVTNADSLDYHVGVALAVLNNGTMPFAPEWFHSRLAGNGEVLNALGLAAGAEQFGALLQCAGLLAIASLLARGEIEGDEEGLLRARRQWLTLAVLSAPVLLFLVSSAKPQLLPTAMTTLALALIVYPSRRSLSASSALRGFTLVCLLVMTAAQAKLSFLLSGGVVGIFALVVMCRRRLALPALAIGLLTAALVFLPPVLWKHHYYGAGLLDALIRPVPGTWPGTPGFDAYLRGYRDGSMPFPLSLLVPPSLGLISTTLGAGLLLACALPYSRDRWVWATAGAALVVGLVGTLMGQVTSRFYLEPYLWLLMALLIAPANVAGERAQRRIGWLVVGQGVAMLVFAWYGAVTLMPGALTATWRSAVMNRSANGYTIMQWAASVLPPDAVLLSGHRSMALAPREAVSMDWANFVRADSPDARVYLERIKDRHVTHMLIIGDRANAGALTGCLGAMVDASGRGHLATRNPFTVGEEYSAAIYRFHADRLPECAARKNE